MISRCIAGFAIDAEDACTVERVQPQVSTSDGALVNDDHVLAQRIERQMSQPEVHEVVSLYAPARDCAAPRRSIPAHA